MYPFHRPEFFFYLISIVFLSFPPLHTHNYQKVLLSNDKVDLIIHFKAVVNGEPLVFKKDYINSFNESFSVEKFRFYVGKIRLIHSGSNSTTSFNQDDYFLVDFNDSSTTSIKISVEPDRYHQILFLLGVDSIHNVSGAQTGALDPLKGMFWTWNSGYVMLKLEGISSISNQPAHALTYHIGGYREPNNTAKNIMIPFASGSELEIKNGNPNELTIFADISKLFSGPHPIHIREIPTCTTPGPLAKSISENYVHMFTIQQIINP